MDKIVIGITGTIGAGKGTVTNFLMQEYHAYNLRYSLILQDILGRLNLPYNRKNLSILAESLRTTFGGDILSRALVAEIRRADANIIVIDGIRKREELHVLKELDGFIFIFIDVAIHARYERIKERNEKSDDHNKTFQEFEQDQERVSDRDVPHLRELADFVIDNNGDYDEMQEQVRTIITTIRK